MTGRLRVCQVGAGLRSVKRQPGRSGAYFAPMSRRHRIAAAFFALFAIVFAQLAVSAHACTVQGQPEAAVSVPGHECCYEEADEGSSPADGLCFEHCQYGDASLDGAQATPGIALAPGPAWRVEGDPSGGSPGDAGTALAIPPPASPSAAILFGVLRI
jgi:hypothetical protein